MRVGLLIYGSLDTVSGGYLYDRMLVRHLLDAGHSVEIISLPWRSYPRHLSDNGSWSLLKRLQTLAVDVLLQDELNHPSLFMMNRWLAHNLGRTREYRAGIAGSRIQAAKHHVPMHPYPIISIVHHLRSDEAHPPLLRKFYRWIEAGYLRSVDGFICNSNTTQRRVRQVTAGKMQPSLVAYPAADHIQPPVASEIFAKLGRRIKDGRPLQILFIGNLIPRKGLHTLLAACAALPPAAWQLLVVGSLSTDRAYTQSVRDAIRRGRMENRVTLAGSVSTAQLREALCSHDLLVVPSFEGFGIVYLEAMAYGLPVIATTAGAARELVTIGETGYLIEPGDAATLAGLLGRLHMNRMHLVAMSVGARRRYDNHVTWQQSAENIASWLETQIA